MAECISIKLGTKSERFAKFDKLYGPVWLCFTLIFKHRTIDLECTSLEQLKVWFMGLQHLAPMSRHYLTLSKFTLKRANLRIRQIANRLHLSHRQVLKVFYFEALKYKNKTHSKEFPLINIRPAESIY